MKNRISYLKIGTTIFLLLEIIFYFLTRDTTLTNQFMIAGTSIKIYGLIIAFSVALGYGISRYFVANKKYNLDDFDNFFLITLLFGIIGARTGFILFDDGAKSLNNFFAFGQGGLSIQGAVAGGLIGSLLYKLFFKKNPLELLEIMMPNLLIAQGIGRLGNYFNQEIFGKPTSSALGMKLSEANVPLQFFGEERFIPTFLIESILLLVAYLIYLPGRNKYNGIKYYLIAYGLIRFFVQFLRMDHQNIVAFLDFPQIISLLMIVFALIIFKNKPKENEKKKPSKLVVGLTKR